MRPLSLRRQMEEAARNPPAAVEAPEPEDDGYPKEPTADGLVNFLASGEHDVELGLRPDRNVAALKACIDRGYVHVRFTGTRGGTELGVRLDPEGSSFEEADFESGTGSVRIEGSLTLNYVPVRCVAAIDLRTLAGKGRLIPAQ